MDAEAKRAENAAHIKKVFQEVEAIIGPTLPVLSFNTKVTYQMDLKKINYFPGYLLLILLTH